MMKIEIKQWALSDAKELTSLCNAVDRRFLSDRLPNPYTEKNAEEWLKTVSENEAVTGIYRAIVYDRKLIGSISVSQMPSLRVVMFMTCSLMNCQKIITKNLHDLRR